MLTPVTLWIKNGETHSGPQMPIRSTHRYEGRRPCLKTCSYPWKLREGLEKMILRAGSVLLKNYIALGIGISGAPVPSRGQVLWVSSVNLVDPCSVLRKVGDPTWLLKDEKFPHMCINWETKSFSVHNLSGLLFKWTLLWFPFLLQNFLLGKKLSSQIKFSETTNSFYSSF